MRAVQGTLPPTGEGQGAWETLKAEWEAMRLWTCWVDCKTCTQITLLEVLRIRFLHFPIYKFKIAQSNQVSDMKNQIILLLFFFPQTPSSKNQIIPPSPIHLFLKPNTHSPTPLPYLSSPASISCLSSPASTSEPTRPTHPTSHSSPFRKTESVGGCRVGVEWEWSNA